jgi:hypothetical protein
MIRAIIRAHTLEQAKELRALGFDHNPVTKMWSREIPRSSIGQWMEHCRMHDMEACVMDGDRVVKRNRSEGLKVLKVGKWRRRNA